MKRLLAGFVAGVVVTLLAVGPVQGGVHNCKPAWKCNSPTAVPTVVVTVAPTTAPTTAPTVTPTSSSSIFDDEFDGTTLSPARWDHDFTCCGVTVMDRSLVTVSGGSLHVPVVNRSGTWYSDMIDTKREFTFTYGYAEARMAIPKGTGLWPAFWLYLSDVDEIDTMEVCANPLGTNGGNDASVLHTTVHNSAGAPGKSTAAGDLSLAWHTYGVDWRPTYIAFYLDGIQVWRETSALIATPKAVLLDLGLGGSWCGNPTSSTPQSSEMLVDWVRVRP